jgi:hypothetical protein
MEHLPRGASIVIRTYRGQSYQLLGHVDHHCRDGRVTQLARWSSWCATCGQLFSFYAPTCTEPFQPNRRCARHRRPGRAVAPPAHAAARERQRLTRPGARYRDE